VSVDIALTISAILVATALIALFSKRVSVSLIALFYSSIMIGIIFTVYGAIIVGLLEIITFAGAVSVMLLSAILMTGESRLDIGASGPKLALVLTSLGVVAIASFAMLLDLPVASSAPESAFSPSSLLQFVWEFRPWDLLILLIVFASAMIVVTNLLSKESQ
jgi:NADH:ubiquinone oxidoreductase subunit 6 (subunit J)